MSETLPLWSVHVGGDVVAEDVADGVVAEDVSDGVVAEDVSDGGVAEDVLHVVLMSSTATICRSWSSLGRP